MKIVRSFVEFEGTPEEFQSVAYIFASMDSEDRAEEEDEEEPVVSPTDAVREMLNRIPIRNGQRAVYRSLANGRLEYGEFLRKTNRKGQEMAGVLGALGRRINGTEAIHDAGLPGDTDALFEWPKVAGKKYIELKPYALEALKIEGVI
jgi:hypothetical protein